MADNKLNEGLETNPPLFLLTEGGLNYIEDRLKMDDDAIVSLYKRVDRLESKKNYTFWLLLLLLTITVSKLVINLVDVDYIKYMIGL